jgi:hypothetical protein
MARKVPATLETSNHALIFKANSAGRWQAPRNVVWLAGLRGDANTIL